MRSRALLLTVTLLSAPWACAGLLELDDVSYPSDRDGGPLADGTTPRDGESVTDGPNPNPDGGGCSDDLDHDKDNCGRCGNQCQVACALGRCVELIASGLAQPTRLLVRDGRIHWVDLAEGLPLGDVSSASLDGGARLARPFSNPADLALGASTLYVWSNAANGVAQGPGLFFCDPNGPCADAGIAGSTTSPVGLAIGGGRVGWCDSTKLITCPDGACGSATSSTLLSGFCSGPSADDAGFCVVSNSGVQCETDAGFAPTGLTGTTRVVVAGDRVFAPTGASASWSPRAPGGAHTRLFQVADEVREIAVDATHVYFTSPNGGYAGRCPLAGCTSPELLLRGVTRPWGIFVDDTNVYVSLAGATMQQNGMIIRFPK